SSCTPLEFFLHFSGIAACTKQTTEVKKENKPVKEPVTTIEKEQAVSIKTENVEIQENTQQEEASIFDIWEKE
ncbi:hypothetical protein, partial [Bacillus thuringiensis]|uniref:hypothetical protein n=1 Tax=Bacillus thuringiensis TaxID=1428 RepID=UPI000CD9E3E2